VRATQDHFKVADAKKAARRNAARAKAMAKIRMLYPLLIVLSAAFGVLLALYGTLCWLTRGSLPDGSYSSTAPGDGSRGGGWGSGAAALLLGRARRRPHALVASSSPRGSPRSGSSSPRKGASGSSGISSTARLLLSTTRKAARLHD
jgi:MYXO-CTERM domain-containing protein